MHINVGNSGKKLAVKVRSKFNFPTRLSILELTALNIRRTIGDLIHLFRHLKQLDKIAVLNLIL